MGEKKHYTRLIEFIPHEEKVEIYNKYISGMYYAKEIYTEHDLSPHTLYKIVEEIKQEIKCKLKN